MSASTATLSVLGAGSILPRRGYGCAGYALRPSPGAPVTLFDCGPGSVRMLAEVGIGLAEVGRVVLSHFHTDHWLDLFALHFARRNPAIEVGKLEVIGPVGLRERVNAAAGVLGTWATDEHARVTEIELDARGRGQIELADVRLSCVRTLHTPESLAWRADLPAGLALAYTGDTGENPDVSELARGVDLYISECSFPDELAVAQHLTPSSAARLARRAECRKLLLSHFYPQMDPLQARERAARIYTGPIECARDGGLHALA